MFNIDEWQIIRDALQCKIDYIAFLRFFGGSIGDAAYSLLGDLLPICDRIDSIIIGEADVEANSQDASAALPKRTASDLDPRGVEDEVFLDHPIHVEQREV